MTATPTERAPPGNRTRLDRLEGDCAIHCTSGSYPATVLTRVPPIKSRLHHLYACGAQAVRVPAARLLAIVPPLRSAGRDSNPQPSPYKSAALTCCATGQLATADLNRAIPPYQSGPVTELGRGQRTARDSNPRPLGYEPNVVPSSTTPL